MNQAPDRALFIETLRTVFTDRLGTVDRRRADLEGELEQLEHERAALIVISGDERLMSSLARVIGASIEAARPRFPDVLQQIFLERGVAMRIADIEDDLATKHRVLITRREIVAFLEASEDFISPGRGWWTRRDRATTE